MKSVLLFLLMGCSCLYAQSTTFPTTGLYFSLNGVIHLPGESVLITDIGNIAYLGDIDNSLVCMTSNVNTKCCRRSDGGNVGEWYRPDGTIVVRNSGAVGDDIFTRSGFTQQVRLNRRANAVGPLGVYRCDVPAEPSGAIISASITILRQGSIKRGANPVRVYNGCPSEEDNADILVDLLQFLSREFGLVPLGRAKSYAALSCEEVADASPQNKAGLYWITDGTNTQQEYCNF